METEQTINEKLNEYYRNDGRKICQMVNKLLFKLRFHDVDVSDFYSLANEIIAKAIKRYDGKQDFDGYIYRCLENKFKTEMTKRNRIKRKADKMALSLEENVGNDEDDLTIGDMVADKKTIEGELFKEEKEEWRKEVKEYLKKLSPLQRKIAFLLSDNNTPDEICEELHITMQHFENSVKRILADERIRPLRSLVERN